MLIRLIVIFLILSPGKNRAQSFYAGLKGGMTTSQIEGDGLSGFDLAGLQLGFFTKRKVAEDWYAQMEISWVQKGSREPISDTSQLYKVKLNYVDIPFLIEWQYKKISLEAGPTLSVLVSSKEENVYGEFTDEEFNRFVLEAQFGVNYYFSDRWKINFRSSYSITPAREFFNSLGKPSLINIGGLGQRNAFLSTALYYSF